MSLLKEFKEFAMRGNVVDLAVGVIIGASFGKITSSLVNDVITPPIGMILGGVDFKALKIDLGGATASGEPVAIKYGMFINTVIDFLLVALVVFFLIKAINALKRSHDGAPQPSLKNCPECLSSIPINAIRCSHCTTPLKL